MMMTSAPSSDECHQNMTQMHEMCILAGLLLELSKIQGTTCRITPLGHRAGFHSHGDLSPRRQAYQCTRNPSSIEKSKGLHYKTPPFTYWSSLVCKQSCTEQQSIPLEVDWSVNNWKEPHSFHSSQF